MKFVADLHIHSPYARATSKEMTLENLDKWAQIKGITVMGTGDFTHPIWFKELQDKLEEAESGLYKLKDKETNTRFMLTSEISCIYSKNGSVRKVHMLLFSPSFDAVEKISARLAVVGNLHSDGRPIIGIDAKEVTRIALEASPDCLVVPAHIWTPWFAVFGSKSGFNTLQECFDEYTKYIYAVETGLSSDPAMNWQVSDLDNVALISNSDSHSLGKIGREANFFDTTVSYPAIADAIKTKDPSKLLFTVEFFPEEGKYHYDGHRACSVSLDPKESLENNNICSVCNRPLTIGVLNRVQELADRKEGVKPAGAIPFKSLIPLIEIIGEAKQMGVASKAVQGEYAKMIEKFGNEFTILLDSDITELQDLALPEIAEGIKRVREGNVAIEPGYDGEYGKIQIFAKGEQQLTTNQSSLF